MENGTTTLDSKILETIQKLLALVADKAATQGEIENATRKVQEILFKYNLSMADVDAHVRPEEVLVDDEVIDFSESWKKSEGNWISSLYYVIGKYNMCSVVLKPGREPAYSRGLKWVTKSIWLIGKPHNVQIVHYLCVQLIPQIRLAEKTAWTGYIGHEKRGVFRRGFLTGCVGGIGSQLLEQERAFREANKKVDAMVVVNDKAIESFMANKFGKLSEGRRSSLGSWDGRAQGRAKGRSMGLRPGVTEGRTGSGNFGGLLGSGNK